MTGNVLLSTVRHALDTPVAPPDNYTRAVEYAIDEEAMTVRQVWVYGGPDDKFYAPFVGDADWMPETENVLVTDGGHVVDEAGVPSDIVPLGRKWARIVEVTHTSPPEKVFELIIETPEQPGFAVYQSDRLARLQPE